MNKTKKIIIVGYSVAVLLAVLIVPWKMDIYRESYSANLNLGYSFVFTPPEEVASVDFGRLFLEILALTAVGVVLYFLTDKQKREGKEWVKGLPPNIFISTDQILQLERIREQIQMDNNSFAFAISGRPAITRQIQCNLYQKLKNLHLDWNEKKLLAAVLISRLEALRKTGDEWLNTEGEFRAVIERMSNINDLCTEVIKHDKEYEGIDLTGWVRDRMDQILSKDSSKARHGRQSFYIERSKYGVKDLILCIECNSRFKDTQERTCMGFLNFVCPECKKHNLYPLNSSNRNAYIIMSIIIGFFLLRYGFIAQPLGSRILLGLIGLFTMLVMIYTLGRDLLIRQRLQSKWEARKKL